MGIFDFSFPTKPLCLMDSFGWRIYEETHAAHIFEIRSRSSGRNGVKYAQEEDYRNISF